MKVVPNPYSTSRIFLGFFSTIIAIYFEFLKLSRFWINWKIENRVGLARQPHCPNIGAQTVPMMSQPWPSPLFAAHGSAAAPPSFHR
jgi:hypothetical protein